MLELGGPSSHAATNMAGSGHGPWHLALTEALNVGFPRHTSARSVFHRYSKTASVTFSNPPCRTRMYGGVAGGRPPPLCQSSGVTTNNNVGAQIFNGSRQCPSTLSLCWARLVYMFVPRIRSATCALPTPRAFPTEPAHRPVHKKTFERNRPQGPPLTPVGVAGFAALEGWHGTIGTFKPGFRRRLPVPAAPSRPDPSRRRPGTRSRHAFDVPRTKPRPRRERFEHPHRDEGTGEFSI